MDMSKVMKCSKDGVVGNLKIGLNGEILQEVDRFSYLKWTLVLMVVGAWR